MQNTSKIATLSSDITRLRFIASLILLSLHEMLFFCPSSFKFGHYVCSIFMSFVACKVSDNEDGGERPPLAYLGFSQDREAGQFYDRSNKFKKKKIYVDALATSRDVNSLYYSVMSETLVKSPRELDEVGLCN